MSYPNLRPIRQTKDWTPSEIKMLRKLYSNTQTKYIAMKLDRGIGAICNMARKLGLRKTKKYLVEQGLRKGKK